MLQLAEGSENVFITGDAQVKVVLILSSRHLHETGGSLFEACCILSASCLETKPESVLGVGAEFL